MAEQGRKYDPAGEAVEKVVHTSGPDIGRVNDQKLARQLAESEDIFGDREGQDSTNQSHDEWIKKEIGKEAASNSVLTDLIATNPEKGGNLDYVGFAEAAKSSVRDAHDRYDQLKPVAKQANQEQESARLRVELAAARKKIAELEGRKS